MRFTLPKGKYLHIYVDRFRLIPSFSKAHFVTWNEYTLRFLFLRIIFSELPF